MDGVVMKKRFSELVIKELEKRKGFDEWWDEIDDDVKEKICLKLDLLINPDAGLGVLDRLLNLENKIYMYNKENEAIARTLIQTDSTLNRIYARLETLEKKVE